jgi:DNA-binding XRE family transcriptional regulator
MKKSNLSLQTKFSKKFRTYLKQISHRLKQLRVARKLTLTNVAHALKLAPRKIFEIEQGKFDFELPLLIDLCDLYGSNLKEVVNFTPQKKTKGKKVKRLKANRDSNTKG